MAHVSPQATMLESDSRWGSAVPEMRRGVDKGRNGEFQRNDGEGLRRQEDQRGRRRDEGAGMRDGIAERAVRQVILSRIAAGFAPRGG